MPVTHPHVTTIQQRVAGQATAGTDSVFALGRAPYAGTVTGVSYIADGAITGHATNNRNLSVINKGLTGAGAVSVAAQLTDAANSFVAFDEKAIPLSGTPANLVVAEGDILQWSSDANSTGVVDPGGIVVVAIARN